MTETAMRYAKHIESCPDCRHAPRFICSVARQLRQLARDALAVRRGREKRRAS